MESQLNVSSRVCIIGEKRVRELFQNSMPTCIQRCVDRIELQSEKDSVFLDDASETDHIPQNRSGSRVCLSEQRHLPSVCANFKSLYPAQISVVERSSGLPKIEKQQAIRLCEDSQIASHVAILTPVPFISLSSANQAILNEYGVKVFGPLKPQSNGHTRINVSEDFTGSPMGYYQYLCASLCSQLFRHLADSRPNP